MSSAEIVTAVLGAGGVAGLGGAGKFVWNKLEARFTKIEVELQECRRREMAAINREADSRLRRAKQIIVIELLWQKVRDMDPKASVLDRAKHLLDELKATAAQDAD